MSKWEVERSILRAEIVTTVIASSRINLQLKESSPLSKYIITKYIVTYSVGNFAKLLWH